MHATSHRRAGRAVTLLVAGALALTTITPALAAVTPTFTTPTPATPTPARSEGGLPPLDPALLRQAVAGLPDAHVTGALVRVSGTAGRWSGTAGVADVRTEAPVPARGRFRIGSATKVFTAVVVLQLVAEGRLDLDGSVQHYLPGLLPRSYPTVTVRQLLDHTSGLPQSHEDAQATDPAWFVEHRFEGWTPREVVGSATAWPMAFRPGTEQRYNGVNYFVAGLLVERVTHHTYAREVRDRIARPLRLHGTYVPEADDPRIRGPHAHGYVDVGGRLADVTRQSPYPWAEGGMVSTSADLTRVLRAVMRGRLLPPAQQRAMFTLPDVDYTGGGSTCALGPDAGRACFGLGLQRTTFPNGVTVWGKSGSVPGYTTAAFATRDLRRVLVFSLNPTGNRDGSEMPYVQRLAAAAFDPQLLA